MTDKIISLDPSGDVWAPLRRLTAARIGLGRRGDAPPLKAVLDFQYAHAKARDAVHDALDTQALTEALPHQTVITVESAAPDRSIYLRRPDLGRRLAPTARARLGALAGTPCDLLFVISDGLSATAVQAHAARFVEACIAKLPDLRIGPIVIATQARVALSDEVGEIWGTRLCASIIGERPGLSVADSLGAYLTFAPRIGRRDSERNCISNIHGNGGLTYDQAAAKFAWIATAALRREVSGIDLRDDGPTLALEPNRAETE